MEKKELAQKDKVGFKIYDVATWLINNYATKIDQYLTKQSSKDNHTMKFGQEIEYIEKVFFKNQAEIEAGRLVPDVFLFF